MDKLITLLSIPIFRKLISITIYTLLLCIFFAGGVFHLFVNNNLQRTEEAVSLFIQKADILANDVEGIMAELQKSAPQKCTEELLNMMRAAQYKSNFAKDIGYSRNNQLICTTGLGILDKPFDEIPPHLVTNKGFSFWFNVPIKLFNFKRVGTVIKKDNFNVLINTEGFFDINQKEFDTAILLKTDEDKIVYRSGDKTLIPEKLEDYNKFNYNGFYSFKCSDQSITCAMAHLPILKAVMNNSTQILGIFILSFMSSTFITLYINGFMNRVVMFKNRFLRNMTPENIKCYYQPVIDVSKGDLVGCEVLVRWSDEKGNIITPDKFLDIVKQEKKTKEFTKVILSNAFREMKNILNERDSFKIAFNIFPVDFSHTGIREMFDKYRAQFPKADINLELTEDELVEAPKISEDINRLRDAGYTVSIDDFGTGYSSLSYLQEIKVDFIKIDRSFVKDLELGTVKSQLIPLIVSIAKTIDSDIIIEGVESAAQVDYVKDLKIEFAQGYYYSKPLPIDEFTEYARMKG